MQGVSGGRDGSGVAKRMCTPVVYQCSDLYGLDRYTGWLSSNVLRVGRNMFTIQRNIEDFEVFSFSLSTITMIFILFCSFWGYLFRVQIVHFHLPPSTHSSCT